MSDSTNPPPGLTIERREDGIIVLRLRDSRRATADAMYEELRESDEKCYAAGRHNRILIDVRGAGWPTPYTAGKALQISKETPAELRVSTAVVAPESVAAHLIDILIQKLPPRTQQAIRIFHDEEDAIAWLNQRLAELGE
jgi:hypothetical protein